MIDNLRNYFDYAASTPCDLEVVKAMEPYWNINFGNPHSRNHRFGWVAETAIETAREKIAELINATPDEIIFTSGATESNNLALKGFAQGIGNERDGKELNKKKKIVSVITEHKCVIESLRYLQKSGFEVVFLPVNFAGLIDLNLLESELKDAALCTISYVNNETGVIQDIPSISSLCRKYGVKLHVDAAQAYGKIPINAREVDMLSISGHKIYGPKGIGALFVSKNPRIRLGHLFSGGGQERGMRSGTLPTPLCVGLGRAAELAKDFMDRDFKQAEQFQKMIQEEMVNKIPDAYINGSLQNKIPHILNISIPYVEGESLMMRLHEFALSSGSACTSKSLEPSHVISAMHPESKDLAHSSIRICFGRFTTHEAVEDLITAFIKNVEELRNLSPLWAMVQKGIDLKTIKWNVH